MQGEEVEDEEEAEEGAAGGEQKVWLRPIPLARHPMIQPLEPK